MNDPQTDPSSAETIRVGVRIRSLSDRRLRYIRQVDATDIFVDHADVDEEPDEFNDRQAATERVEAAGLSLTGIQSLPYSLYGDIMFDRAGKSEALEQITTLVRNLGEAEIPILGYQWNPRGEVPMRTGTAELRGGARGTAFDYDEIDDPDALAPGIDREYTEAEF